MLKWIFFFFASTPVQGFLFGHHCRVPKRISISVMRMQDQDDAALISEAMNDSIEEDSKIHDDLEARYSSLQSGIGRRYITRTQHGFLNVHDEPTDPFDCENIVSQLVEGQVVTSTKPAQGDWICHDGGGWSISKYQGFVWLEELKE